MTLQTELRGLLTSVKQDDLVWHDLPAFGPRIRTRFPSTEPGNAVDLVRSCLESHPETRELERRVLNLGDKHTTLTIETIAQDIVTDCFAIGVDSAIQGLLSFLQTESMHQRHISTFFGPRPVDSLRISSDMEVYPYDTLSPNTQASYERFCMAGNAAAFREFPLMPRPAHSILPTMAAVLTLRYEPKWLGYDKDIDEHAFRRSTNHAKQRKELFRSSLDLLAMVDCKRVRRLWDFNEFIEWFPSDSGSAQTYALDQFVFPKSLVRTWGEEEIRGVESLLRDFVGATPTCRSRIRVAVERFGMALEEKHLADKAIDLGIALESLLTEDSDEQSSIAMRMRLRGARLLEETIERRKEVAREINDLYTCRSASVHTGKLQKKLKNLKKDSHVIVEDGLSLVARLVRKFLASGIPEWDKVIYS